MSNIYDLDAKTFLFKMYKPDSPKVLLLVESGVRFHPTKYERDKASIPSGFSMKLRTCC